MPNANDEFRQLLSDIKRVLIQQRDLFGDTLLTSPEPETRKPDESAVTAKKKYQVGSEEPDLFGFVAPKTPTAQHKLPAYPDEAWVSKANLADFESTICTCVKCALGQTRTKFVFGVGSPNADIVLIGEAPGADEDLQGEPFVGRAGQLLNKILEAIQLKREEVYICNILKCRPPNNRDPQPDEIDTCEPYLWKQLELIKPKIIVCLGRVAAQTLLRTSDSLNDLRGKVHDYRGMKLTVTYHPAALLRNPNWKRPAWEDVQWIRKTYDQMKSDEKNNPSR